MSEEATSSEEINAAVKRLWDHRSGASARGVGSVNDPVKVILVKTETCTLCEEEHLKGTPCPSCGRSLLLG